MSPDITMFEVAKAIKENKFLSWWSVEFFA